jgi:hypothetical protein
MYEAVLAGLRSNDEGGCIGGFRTVTVSSPEE